MPTPPPGPEHAEAARPLGAPPTDRSFAVKDCALIAIATGRKAHTLREFLAHLSAVDAESVYHHFWAGMLLPRFEEREYYNDFAAWAAHGLHDDRFAERLAVIDPDEHRDFEALRQRVVDVTEERLEEDEALQWTRASMQFAFLRSQIVVFDTGRRADRPEDLVELVPQLSSSSVFYHFVDARRRTADGTDDFSAWIAGYGGDAAELLRALRGIDPYFGPLSELRERLARIFAEKLGGGSA